MKKITVTLLLVILSFSQTEKGYKKIGISTNSVISSDRLTTGYISSSLYYQNGIKYFDWGFHVGSLSIPSYEWSKGYISEAKNALFIGIFLKYKIKLNENYLAGVGVEASGLGPEAFIYIERKIYKKWSLNFEYQFVSSMPEFDVGGGSDDGYTFNGLRMTIFYNIN